MQTETYKQDPTTGEPEYEKRTQRGGDLRYDDMEHPTGESCTVPDENMSVREILERYSRGQKIDGLGRQGVFDDTDDFDAYDQEKLKNEDLFDLEMEKQKLSEAISEFQKTLSSSKQKKEEGARQGSPDANTSEQAPPPEEGGAQGTPGDE
jgi:hypothetical protein